MSPNQSEEQWRPVVGFEDLYEVSDQGRVRSLPRTFMRSDGKRGGRRGKVRKLAWNTSGYAGVQLMELGVPTMQLVHRMALFAFVGEPAPGLVGCHNDGDKTNNALSNLRWDTSQANSQDTVRHGRHYQANQTHCKRGHEFAGHNLRVLRNGRRACRECTNAHTRAHYYRQKAKAA